MLVGEGIAKIRRAYFVQGKSIKAICRELRVSRKIVRKVVRPETTEFHYKRKAQPLPRIGPWQEHLNRLLTGSEAKPRRERLVLVRIFEKLRELGYEGMVTTGSRSGTNVVQSGTRVEAGFSAIAEIAVHITRWSIAHED